MRLLNFVAAFAALLTTTEAYWKGFNMYARPPDCSMNDCSRRSAARTTQTAHAKRVPTGSLPSTLSSLSPAPSSISASSQAQTAAPSPMPCPPRWRPAPTSSSASGRRMQRTMRQKRTHWQLPSTHTAPAGSSPSPSVVRISTVGRLPLRCSQARYTM